MRERSPPPPSAYDWDEPPDWDEHEVMRDAIRTGKLYQRRAAIKSSWRRLLTDWWFAFGLAFIVWSLFLWWLL